MAECIEYKRVYSPVLQKTVKRCAEFAGVGCSGGCGGMEVEMAGELFGKPKGRPRGRKNPVVRGQVTVQDLAIDSLIAGVGGLVVKNVLNNVDFYKSLTAPMKTIADFSLGILAGYVVGNVLKQPGFGYPIAIGLSAMAATNLVKGVLPSGGLGLYEVGMPKRFIPTATVPARPGIPGGVIVR